MKNNKGITLIALVITIVVLLILAMVSIRLVMNGGIIAHAENATSSYKISEEKEKIALAYSEYQMAKYTDPNPTLKVEGAQAIGSEESGWKVKFDKTNSIYKVAEDGSIEYTEDEEFITMNEQELAFVYYMYNSMYNITQEDQKDIVPTGEWYDDADGDKKSDVNSNLGAYYRDGEFNIPVTFFAENPPEEGNINAIITHYDGTTQPIKLTTTDNKTWTYEFKPPFIYDNSSENTILTFRSNASEGYHYLDLGETTVMPFYKLTILGKEIVFSVNCQAMVAGVNSETGDNGPIYTNIDNVSKITVVFSDNSKKEYTKNHFFDMGKYIGNNYYYSSQDIPILYAKPNGMLVINVPGPAAQNPIASIMVEENGMATKYNVTASTEQVHCHPGD